MDQANLKDIPGIGGARMVSAAFALMAAALIIVQSACLAQAVTALWGGASLAEAAGAVAGFFSAYACRLGIVALQERSAERFAERASSELRRAYLDALGSAGPEISHRFGAAACVLNATEGIASVRSYLADAVPKKASLVVVPLCLAVAICCFDVLSGVIALVCLPLIMVFMQLVGHTASDDAARRHTGFTQMSNHFLDALRGLSTLRAFGRARTYGNAVFAASESYRRHVMRTLRTATLSSTVLDVFATCGLAAVAIMLGFRMVDGEVLFFPALTVLLLVPEFFMPIRAYARGYHATLEGASALAALERALLFADEQAALEVEYESIESELALDRAISAPGIPEVRLEGVSIAHGRHHHVLSKVGFSLAGARLVVVTGPSGAGKSSLLDVLAGFADPTSGRIYINGEEAETLRRPDWHGRVSYIPQRPHLFNATLKENVAFYRPDASDEEVISALRQVDLGWLAEGEQGLDLMLGEGGRALSGGEAHRIALARTLVDGARDVILLDEPTAHLDIETELQLKRVLLRAFSDKLVIMATHNLHWVRVADVHLQVEGGTVQVLGAEAPALRQEEAAVSVHPPEARRRHGHEQDPNAAAGSGGADAPVAAKPEPRAERAAGGRLIRSLFRMNAPLIACAMALAFAAALFAGGLMFTSGYMISVAASLPVTVLALHLPSIFVRIFGVGKPLLDYVQRLLSHDWILRATSALRKRLFEAARSAFESARPERLSDMLATLSDDIARTQDLFIRCALPYGLALLLVVATSCAAAAFSLPFGLILFVLLSVATVGLSVAALAMDGRLKDEEAAGERSLYGMLTDDVMGLRDIVLAGRGRERAQQVLKAHVVGERIRMTLGAHKRARAFTCQLLLGCAILLCLIWAAAAFTPSVPTPQGLSPAAHGLAAFAVQNESPCPQNWITAFAICLFPLIEFFLPATEALLDGSVMRKGADRIGALLESASASADGSAAWASACEEDPQDAANAVEVDIRSLRYPDAAQDALSGITLTIPRGSLTAVIGPSGAGKTTLVRAIARDLPFAVPGVRRAGRVGRVGLIEQESYLFNKSLRENLLIAKGDADDGELEEVLRRVGLSGLLERLPKGLDAVLASGGEDVSGGEATRIAVARALLAGFDTIVLDEPFRALDADTEAEVMATIQEALVDRTVIVVTHHLQGVSAFDRVVFVDGGRIIAQGAPADLAASDSRFRALLECAV